jgi:hypothetical protein
VKTTAQCSCGQLSAEIVGEPDAVVMCHCIACQRRSGSPFGAAAYYLAECVTLTGVSKRYMRVADSGNEFTTGFCPECGSSVWLEGPLKPGVIGITVGAIADPAFPVPVRSVWEQTRHSWVDVDDIPNHFPRGRS